MNHASPQILRLGHSLESLRPSLHNGPGWRVNLWTQGCSLRCTQDCLNPHFLDEAGGMLYTVEEVAQAVVRVARQPGRPAEGATVLGGEPTDQIDAVTELLKQLRAAGLSTMLYTGYYLPGLRNNFGPRAAALLSEVDLLMDGPYQASHHDDQAPWRGSTNQTLHRISSRYSQDDLQRAFAAQGKAFSIDLRPSGSMVNISVSGFQITGGSRVLTQEKQG